MITIEDARKIAMEKCPLSQTLLEHIDAYEFYQSGVDNTSIFIMKKNGAVLDVMTYNERYLIPRKINEERRRRKWRSK